MKNFSLLLILNTTKGVFFLIKDNTSKIHYATFICLKVICACTENVKMLKKNVFLKMNTEACQGETT